MLQGDSLRAALIAVAVGSAAMLAFTDAASNPRPTEPAPARILVFSKTAGFRHDSIPDGIQALREIGREDPKRAFEIHATEDASIFTDEALAAFAAVVFLSTTGDILDDAQQAAFERYIRKGGGYAGVHAASDTEYDWPWYGRLVGAYFLGHPAIQPAVVLVEDRAHPSTSMLPERWERTDEWYAFRDNPRSRVRVLARLDESSYDPGSQAMGDHPIAWWHEFDGGRSWYTAGGHTKESFSEPLFRAHLKGGILWAAGRAGREPAPGSGTKLDSPVR